MKRFYKTVSVAPAEGGFGVLLDGKPVKTPARNALTFAMYEQMAAICETVNADRSIKAMILTGAGPRAFAAGADIAALAGMSPGEAQAFSELGHRVAATIAALPVPVIAAVNGFALGGGCEMALACDFIFSTDAARFGLPEVKRGLIAAASRSTLAR